MARQMRGNLIALTLTSPPHDNLCDYKGYEFTFWLNEGNVGRGPINWMVSLCENIAGKQLSYEELTR